MSDGARLALAIVAAIIVGRLWAAYRGSARQSKPPDVPVDSDSPKSRIKLRRSNKAP